MKQLLNRIKSNSFLNDLIITFAGQILVMLVTFVINKVISNQYSITDFGTYNLIKRSASVITFVMLMAMGIAIPKYIAESTVLKNHEKIESYMLSGLFIITGAFLIITIFLMAFNKPFALLMFGDVASKKFVLPICLYSFGTCLVTYAYSFYRGINDFIKYNIICFAMQVGLLALIFVTSKNLVILHYIWGFFLIFYGVCRIISIFKRYHVSLNHLKQKLFTMKIMLVYSIPRIPGEAILFAYNLVPLIIITNRFGLEKVAYFSVAISINTLVSPLFSLVGTILLPLVSKSIVTNKIAGIRKKIQILGLLYFLISIVAIATVYLFGEWLLVLLYSSDYINCIGIVRISIISIIPNAFYLLLRNPLDGISKFPYNTICLMLSFIVYVVMLVLASSIEMCAISLIVAYSFLGIMSLLFWKHAVSKVSK